MDYLRRIYRSIEVRRVMSDWQNTLYNGLVTDTGRPPNVAAGNITKPMHNEQLSDRMLPTLEVMSNNTQNRGIAKRNYKQRFSIHRAINFLPQE